MEETKQEIGDKEDGIEEFITANRVKINSKLEEILKQDQEIVGKETLDAATYVVLDNGHRWRPLLAIAAYKALTKNRNDHQEENDSDDILNAACAVEFLHSASLIYDDIMDKSELRRGKPTCHIRYGEPVALLAFAYLVSRADLLFSKINSDISSLSELKFLAINGMIYGQTMDVTGNVKDESSLLKAHKLKSAIYTLASEVAWVIFKADEITLKAITDYSEKIGIAYLIEDDILDVESTQEESGKPVGQDKRLRKFTAVDAYGIDGAKTKMQEYVSQAKQAIANVPNNQLLIAFVDYMFSNKKAK